MLIIFDISGLALFAGCGDSSAPMPDGPSTTPLSITFAPFSNNCSGVRCVQIGGMEQFSVSVSCAIGVTCPLASSQGVTWSVAGTGCSGASCGTIDATGKYSAPATVPNPDRCDGHCEISRRSEIFRLCDDCNRHRSRRVLLFFFEPDFGCVRQSNGEHNQRPESRRSDQHWQHATAGLRQNEWWKVKQTSRRQTIARR